MSDDIDFKKLLIQEPDFKKFLEQALVGGFLGTKQGRELIRAIHNFYRIGLTPKQVSEFMINQMRSKE